MCNVHISMILEGLEYCILSRKVFAKVTPKAERVSSICLLLCDVFDVPPIPCVWGIINIWGDIWDWQIIIFIHIYTTVYLLLLYLSYLCLTVYCIPKCIVQHLNMTLYSSTTGKHIPVRGGWNRLALGTSAFCNVTLSWCSRVLYT